VTDAPATVVHAYGVVAAGARPDLPPGLGDCPVTTLDVAGLQVLVSRLPEASYGERAWQEHAEDLAWLGEVVAEHHRVVQAVAEQVDVVPLRLAPGHHDEEALVAALEPRAAELAQALELVRDRVELGVKAFAGEPSPPAAEAPRPASGRDYLTRRSRAAQAEEGRRDAQDQAVAAVHRAAQELAVDSRVNAPQDSALSGRSEVMLLNAAYLVPRADEDRFRSRIAQLEEEARSLGLELECTGPWPPYNFTAPPREQEAS
jgi:hypothetical protein